MTRAETTQTAVCVDFGSTWTKALHVDLASGAVKGQHFCVLVDELIGKQEVVIKGLGGLFRNVRGVAGGAILGDGRVGLILDMAGLRRSAA